MQDIDQYITAAELASRLGCAVITLEKWRQRGEGPHWVRVGKRAVRYRVRDVEAWLAEQVQP